LVMRNAPVPHWTSM